MRICRPNFISATPRLMHSWAGEVRRCEEYVEAGQHRYIELTFSSRDALVCVVLALRPSVYHPSLTSSLQEGLVHDGIYRGRSTHVSSLAIPAFILGFEHRKEPLQSLPSPPITDSSLESNSPTRGATSMSLVCPLTLSSTSSS